MREKNKGHFTTVSERSLWVSLSYAPNPYSRPPPPPPHGNVADLWLVDLLSRAGPPTAGISGKLLEQTERSASDNLHLLLFINAKYAFIYVYRRSITTTSFTPRYIRLQEYTFNNEFCIISSVQLHCATIISGLWSLISVNKLICMIIHIISINRTVKCANRQTFSW